ncbi:MAG: glycoside hydrolase family 3 C-terminal domain-containing protein [Clostridia bacterium]|nr:glycoside hydrolase family 3 C-terminal domain-containing protein [Clostridia bacterium]
MLKHKDIISEMTLEEKAGFCSGKDFWHLKSIERLCLPEVMVCDGPHGLRKQNSENDKVGITNSYPATCFPTAATTACSWDPELIGRMGEALGEECLKEEVSVLLGPGVNMKRSPLCGRNFEYFSEDPELAGEMAASFINGVQSKGIGTSLKHFACNSQEMKRMTSNSVVDERALREIYLRAFEIAFKKAQPATVMNAYNLINGTYCSENDWLQNKVLRDEWGFKGLVVTDWGACNNRVDGIKAGNDLEMPSSGGHNEKKLVDAVRLGELDEAVLDQSVDRIIDLILKAREIKKKRYTYDVEAHHKLAKEISAKSTVLLKNDDNILPLKAEDGGYVAVIGRFAEVPRYQGAGSSGINPTRLDSCFDSFKEANINIKYAEGYFDKGRGSKRKNTRTPDDYIYEACTIARKASKVVLFVGLTDAEESEGFDRRNMELPQAHNRLIDSVCNVNDNVIVVLQGGSPVEMPWLDKVKGVVNTYLGGQAVDSAVADILTGKINPSGKLAESYPCSVQDTPTASCYPNPDQNVEYRESIFIGYRYYDKVDRKVNFPFGFGLSYTTFEYSDFKINRKTLKKGMGLSVSFKIKNTGSVAGAEIAQIYVSKPESKTYRAPKELKGFKKVYLEPDETKKVTVELEDRAFMFWNTSASQWCTESGKYEILVGASSRDIRLSGEVKMTSDDDALIPEYSDKAEVYFSGDPAEASEEAFRELFADGELPFAAPITPDSLNVTIEYGKDKGFSKFLYNTVDAIMKPNGGIAGNMMANTMMQTPVRNFVAMSGGLFTEDMADGLLNILDGKDVVKGVGKVMKGVPNALINLKSFLKTI